MKYKLVITKLRKRTCLYKIETNTIDEFINKFKKLTDIFYLPFVDNKINRYEYIDIKVYDRNKKIYNKSIVMFSLPPNITPILSEILNKIKKYK